MAGDVKRLTKDLDRERRQAEDNHSRLQTQIDELQERLDHASLEVQSAETDDTVRAILLPLLALAANPPPSDDVPVDHLAQLVRDEYEELERQLSLNGAKLALVTESAEKDRAKANQDRDTLRSEVENLYVMRLLSSYGDGNTDKCQSSEASFHGTLDSLFLINGKPLSLQESSIATNFHRSVHRC